MNDPHDASGSSTPAHPDLLLYKRVYGTLYRTQLEKRDRPLYMRLKRAGLLHHVPYKRRRRNHLADPLGYYHRHYEGMLRGELATRDPGVYFRLRKLGMLIHVPRKHRDIPDPLAYYREHYQGMTRGELSRRDPGLYRRLLNFDLLTLIPKKQTRARSSRPRASPKADPVLDYLARYPGLRRGELQLRDAALYGRLRRAGKLGVVPTVRLAGSDGAAPEQFSPNL